MGSDDLFRKEKSRKKQKKQRNKRKLKDSILIICEGEKTEPLYFKGFPVAGVKVEVQGTGRNTLSLIEEAEKRWRNLAETNQEYYENLWCVMDRDSFPDDNYDNAFAKIEALEKKFRKKKYRKHMAHNFTAQIAYSNEAFELWYILHFSYLTTGIHRSQYEKMLSKHLGHPYKKNSPEMYRVLRNLEKNTDTNQGIKFAINNAQKLREGIPDHEIHKKNPSTTVDLLVQELFKHCQ